MELINSFIAIIPYAIGLITPLLITSLGGLFSERSGVINIGLEGQMIVGAFVSALLVVKLYDSMGDSSLWLALVAAVVIGALFSLLHAFASVTLNANQVISGTAINMIALALCEYLARNITGSGNITIMLGIRRMNVPILSDIPIINIFFKQIYPTTYIILAILLISWFILYKTAFGLRLRACGDNPHAADAAGINVYKMRYIGVMISGAFASLGGAIVLLTYAGEFNSHLTVTGLGFLSLAALVFGQWRPLGILLATSFFGYALTIATVSLAMPAFANFPPVIMKIFPYIITICAIVIFSKSARGPKSAGVPYDKGQR